MYQFKRKPIAAKLSQLVCGLALTPCIALAQNNVFLEEVVVTAQKREQSLQDVGVSVTAFSGDQIRKLGITDTINIAAQTPALQIQQQHPNVTTINIRGVSQNDFSSHLEAPVAVYVDDAYVSSMGAAHAQMFDVERVEVLRGPQGTLFGRNATGGLVHFISKKPTEEFEAYADLTLAEYSQTKFEGAISGPLSENILGRVSIASNKHDGVLENRIGEDLRAADTKSIRGQLQINASDDLTVGLKASYTKDDTVGNSFSHAASSYNMQGLGEFVGSNQTPIYFGLFDPTAAITGPCPGCDPRGHVETDNDVFEGAFDFIGHFQRDIYNYQVNVDWQLSDNVTFTSITDYFDMVKDYGEDTDSSPFTAVHFTEIEEREQFSQEFRFSGESESVNWTAGAYYLDFETDTGGTVLLDAAPLATFLPPPSFGMFPAFNDPSNPCFSTGPCAPGTPGFLATFGHSENIESESWAVFGHLEFSLTDALTLVAALRYTDDEREMNLTIDNIQLGAPGLQVFNLEQDFDNISAKLQLDWEVTDEWLLYAGLSRGHKAGNFAAPLFALMNPSDTSSLTHDEEVLHSLEVGAKGAFWDGRARLNASVFYYDYKDYQASSFVQLTQQINNRDATAYGGEIELTLVPTDALTFIFGASFIESEVEDVGMPNGSFQDRELPNAPSFSFNGLGRYTVSVSDGFLMTFQADFSYQDDSCFTVVCHPVEEEDDFIVGNARISLAPESDKWEVAVFVNNIGDEEYRVFAGDASFVGNTSSSFGAPRWYGASVSYRWD